MGSGSITTGRDPALELNSLNQLDKDTNLIARENSSASSRTGSKTAYGYQSQIRSYALASASIYACFVTVTLLTLRLNLKYLCPPPVYYYH